MAAESTAGKTILITGATDGIGKQAAKELAVMGAHVVLVGRSKERGEQAAAEVSAFSRNPQVDYLVADLSSMGEVKALADAFRAKYDRLDVLVNNAGANFLRHSRSVDGIEMTFALNHLAYFLLTNLLLDMLQASAPSRVVNTASDSHLQGKIHFDDLNLKRFYFVYAAYAQSKLANVMFSYALARHLEGSRVTVNTFHPGLVHTGIVRKLGFFGPLIDSFVARKAISVEEGAETLVYLAASPEVEGQSGHYWYKKEIKETNPQSYNLDDQERLWELSEQMVKDWL